MTPSKDPEFRVKKTRSKRDLKRLLKTGWELVHTDKSWAYGSTFYLRKPK